MAIELISSYVTKSTAAQLYPTRRYRETIKRIPLLLAPLRH
ncbi:hypothetical protein PROSTU_04746 [Providencia stuartii ATCC 25827]|uniref:Uncharacterized protein n=1 Tax=Providencia stuartii ATCC 25827 TaxID=471874 RepID=A0AA86YEF9_PROST|nr:hypothetical protein PROSTU_04746 [Providencia stuartii ATCC 25827]